MMRNLLVVCVALGLAVGVDAEQRKIKKKPVGASYDESKKTFKAGEKVERTVLVPKQVVVAKQVKVGNEIKTVQETVTVMSQQKAVIVIPERKWMLGAQGWHDFEGFNIDNLVNFNINNNIIESPLTRVKAMVNNTEVLLKIEPNDVITKIDGKPVTTELDLFLAIHDAANPRALPIEVISFRDGSTYTGTVSCMKVK